MSMTSEGMAAKQQPLYRAGLLLKLDMAQVCQDLVPHGKGHYDK